MNGEPQKLEEAPDIDNVQQDIGFANAYRLESMKILIAIAAALFAFTVSFPVSRADGTALLCSNLAWISWVLLGLSMSFGWLNMTMWEWFYISYRDYDWVQKKKGAGNGHRKTVTLYRRWFLGCQLATFVLGVITVGTLAAVNISYA